VEKYSRLVAHWIRLVIFREPTDGKYWLLITMTRSWHLIVGARKYVDRSRDHDYRVS